MHIRIEDIESPSPFPAVTQPLSFRWWGVVLSLAVHVVVLWALSLGTSKTPAVSTSPPAIKALLWFPPAAKEQLPLPPEQEAVDVEEVEVELAPPSDSLEIDEQASEEQEVTNIPSSPAVEDTNTASSEEPRAIDFSAKGATQRFLNTIDRNRQEALAQEAIREFRYQSTHPDIPHWSGTFEQKEEVDPIAVNCDSTLNETLAMLGKLTGGRVSCSDRSDFDYAVQQRLGRLKPLTPQETKN